MSTALIPKEEWYGAEAIMEALQRVRERGGATVLFREATSLQHACRAGAKMFQNSQQKMAKSRPQLDEELSTYYYPKEKLLIEELQDEFDKNDETRRVRLMWVDVTPISQKSGS